MNQNSSCCLKSTQLRWVSISKQLFSDSSHTTEIKQQQSENLSWLPGKLSGHIQKHSDPLRRAADCEVSKGRKLQGFPSSAPHFVLISDLIKLRKGKKIMAQQLHYSLPDLQKKEISSDLFGKRESSFPLFWLRTLNLRSYQTHVFLHEKTSGWTVWTQQLTVATVL